MAGFRRPGLFMITTFLLFIYLFIMAINADESEVEDESPFTYETESENGPENWGSLDPKWKACQTGKFQSPIELLDDKAESLPALGDLRRTYKPAPAIVRNRGHDISLAWRGDAGGVTINGTEYKLLQCHWHTPSEHTVDGKRFDMELHMVHRNSRGQIAVIGMLYESGSPDEFLAKLLSTIKSVDKEGTPVGIINPWAIKLRNRSYYRYIGSLTVPPCTEGVVWTIIKRVGTVSKKQIKTLRNAVHDGFEENARPVQELHGRNIYAYRPKDRSSTLYNA